MAKANKPKPSRITVPPNAHPAARLLFKLMAEQHVTYDFLEFYSGVLRSTTKAYRASNTPGLSSIQANLGVLGWEFLPVPKAEKLPPEVREDLAAVVEKWKLTGDGIPELVAACANLPLDTKPAPGSLAYEAAGLGPAIHPELRVRGTNGRWRERRKPQPIAA